MKTPVAFFAFNRPDNTRRVLERIAAARPERLLLVTDGPRAGHAQDAENVARVRAILQDIRWPCEVSTNFAERNMGCRARLASGTDWVFEQCEEAILLEDDCLPDPTFFSFCEELLERYRHEPRVFLISGNNFAWGADPPAASYYFSRYSHLWGWASWRRAWSRYDLHMAQWQALRTTTWLKGLFDDGGEAAFWRRTFDAVASDRISTWDYQVQFALWQHGGLAAVPEYNLVQNIGFGPDSTHTANVDDPHLNVPTRAIDFPLRHPDGIERSEHHDRVERWFLRPGETPFARLRARWRKSLQKRWRRPSPPQRPD